MFSNFKVVGEVGVVTTKEKVQDKLSKQGATYTFVGYTEHHSRDVHRILYLNTNLMIISCVIIWLNKTYKELRIGKTTISKDEKETIELPTGNDKTISNKNAIKDIEYESYK
jgi:hypothetical protein